MNIALAHDSFTQAGGAERVVDVFHEMYPEAPVFTLVLDRKFKDKYQGWDIRTSWLQVLYNFIPRLQYLLPFIPPAVSSLKFDGYDLIISSSSSWIKNIKVPKNCAHICYCHTPTRFLWVDDKYLDQELPRFLKPIKFIILWFLGWMRRWDFKGAQRVTRFIANSKEVQQRIKQFYHRDSEVIYPFIDTGFWRPVSSKGDYFLIAGRLQAHKHNDLVIEIFNDLKIPLHIVGTGRQDKYLKSIALENIKFLGRISDEQLREEYSGAKGLISPQLEDFGLIPLEAAACGTATLGLGQGGNLETIIPGVTGELFEDYDRKKIKKMILDWDPQKYSTGQLRQHAEKFSKNNFIQQILECLKFTPNQYNNENRG
jgi:glycosyltransferase involved in cell wall biosynthesis